MYKEVHLLGEVQVFDGQDRHVPRFDKRLALLGYLACQGGEWVERERLAYLFWPDIDNENARTNLRGLLARCRSLPFTGGLEREPTRLRWRVSCDVARFRRAVASESWDEAIDLYRGEFFGGASFDDSGEFTSWLEMERASLNEAYRSAVLKRTEGLVAAGLLEEAVRPLEGLLRHDSLDEEALRLLMRLLDETGRPEQATAYYRSFRKVLAEKLDLEPSAVTEELERSIRLRAEGNPAGEASTAASERTFTGGRPFRSGTPKGGGSGASVAAAPLNTFVGRDLELAELAHLLQQPANRLVTLTGPGGVGKTRLAHQAVEELSGSYADGAYFVPLDGATTAAAIPLTLAEALGIVLHGKDGLLQQVVRALSSARVLLVLDNYEQLLEGVTIPAALLAGCPHLDLVVTSRERLGLSEEWLMPLKGMSYPAAEVPLEEALASDAISFFAARAGQVRPSFEITEEMLPHLLQICRLVDGLPLGLELAAVWVRVMPVEEIALEMKRNLDFLSSSNRNVPDRHRSVRAAFEHSWSLLTGREQEVMRKLAAFRGGFRREAAAFVAGASIPILAALIDKSLLRVAADGRYDRHPLLLQFSSEKLAEHPAEEREARDKHAGYFASLSEEAGRNDYSPQQESWLARLATEYDNFRAALDWIEASGQAELGYRLIGSLNWYWGWRGIVAEPREWQRRVFAIPGAQRTAARAKALRGAGVKATLQGELEVGRTMAAEALEISREVGDRHTEILALYELADVAFTSGDREGSTDLFEEGLALSNEVGDEALISLGLAELGALNSFIGRYDLAEQYMERSAALSRKLGDHAGLLVREMHLGRIAWEQGDTERGRSLLLETLAGARNLHHLFIEASSLLHLGIVATEEGEYDQARAYLHEALEAWWEAGITWRVTLGLEAFAVLEAADSEPLRAAILWGAAEALRDAHVANLTPVDQKRHDTAVAQARCRLETDRFEAAWVKGRAMDARRAIAFAGERLSKG